MFCSTVHQSFRVEVAVCVLMCAGSCFWMWAWVLACAWAHVSGCERGRWHARGHMFLDASVGAGMRAGICFWM